MKRLLSLCLFLSLFTLSSAQKHEIGIYLGPGYIVGDVGNDSYIQTVDDLKKIPISAGVFYRRNLNERQSVRLNLSYNRVFFDDSYSDDEFRKKRDLRGDNTIIDASALFEYNFFDVNQETKFAHSPYIFAGIGGFGAKDPSFTMNASAKKDAEGNPIKPNNPEDYDLSIDRKDKTKFDLAIPFGVGYKFKFNYNWAVNVEFMARYTMSDNLDYSNPNKKGDHSLNIQDGGVLGSEAIENINQKYESLLNGTGNTHKSNDWYMSINFGVSYSFGRPPCNC